jgi:DNA cross-link repair 1A protein
LFIDSRFSFSQAAGTNQSPSIASILADSSIHNYSYTDLKVSKQSTTAMQLYPVPYSEHSSFYELTCFAMSFSWVKMIATVNVGSESSRAKMAKWVAKWEAERRKRGKDTVVFHHHTDYW